MVMLHGAAENSRDPAFCIRSKHTCEGARTREENNVHEFQSPLSAIGRNRQSLNKKRDTTEGLARCLWGDFDAEKTIQPIFDRKKGRVPFGCVAGRIIANVYPMFELPRKRFLRFVLAKY